MALLYESLDNIIRSGFDLGLQDYPIFDESYRDKLNAKILEHYYFREINGTADRFKFYLNRALNEIMPRYNKIYEAELLAINPLLSFKKEKTINTDEQKNVDTVNNQVIENTSTIDNTTQNTTNESGSASNVIDQFNDSTNQMDEKLIGVKSDTPQTELLVGDIESNLYATEGSVDDNTKSENQQTSINKDEVSETSNNVESESITDTDTTSNTTLNNTIATGEEMNKFTIESEEGFTKPQIELIEQYRNAVIDVDMMVINDKAIKECFLMVYY